MKIDSKISGCVIVLLAIAMIVSAASAVDLASELKNDDFKISAPSGADFTESVNIAANDMKMVIFENSGNSSGDANSIIYFKDSSADKTEINTFINDLENQMDKVEDTDKYVVLKNNHDFSNFNIGDNIDSAFNIAESVLPSGDGLNLSADGNSISLSSEGLKVSDAGGEKVSITSEGISATGNSSSDNASVDVSGDVDSNIENSDYSLYLKNQNSDRVIVISGNNLELLKAMAESATFTEN